MSNPLIVRLFSPAGTLDLPAAVRAAGSDAARHFEAERGGEGVHLLLAGDRDYHVLLDALPGGDDLATLRASEGRRTLVLFPGRRAVRRTLRAIGGRGLGTVPKGEVDSSERPVPLDLTAGLAGAAPLHLFPDGRLGAHAGASPPAGMAALDVLVTAARWVSSRRTSSFERLFPPSAFHPDEPQRPERLDARQARGLLDQVGTVLSDARVGGAEAIGDPARAAQARSACLTVLSHVVATSLRDPDFREPADAAATAILALIDAEADHATAFPSLRSHAIQLLQMRAPALTEAHRARVRELLRSLVRTSPPYAELTGPWRFAMASAHDFHAGECEILTGRYGFKEISVPEGAPEPPGWGGSHYRAFEAPFRTPAGEAIQVLARAASPRDENFEMGEAFFAGTMINRHAQLGAFDMQASLSQVRQVGFKLMVNSQCAGLTTRFAISRLFPGADVYSSWDSTYFRTGAGGKVVASEGLDCFVAILRGMSAGEGYRDIDERIRKAQWHHVQARFPEFVQFVGPAHPLVVGRYTDVNHDGRADYYDGFLDLTLVELSQEFDDASRPRDPGVSASRVGGAAARGLGWAAGSMNRVTQYSEIWDGLPGQAEAFYAFQAAGFYSHLEPPRDVPVGRDGPRQDLPRLPALCRYLPDPLAPGGLTVDVMFHSWLAHAPEELKRLLVAAEALWRALDTGHLETGRDLASPLQRRGALLLLLAGLLEFPSDQNRIDALWGAALSMLSLPPLSRSVVRRCNSDADHDAGNYYGSFRGLAQLVGRDGDGGELRKADPLAWEVIASGDPMVGRAAELDLTSAPAPVERLVRLPVA
ncbi:hypothetical protein L6R50_04900 [Myxococcota bacterium]|nr:hypothetical protein [Myxococcota bacterium]